MIIRVDAARREIGFAGSVYGCEIGVHGVVPSTGKREGDGRTPLGRWPVRGVILRPDGDFGLPSAVPSRWCHPSDGWCDDPMTSAYNRPVRRPVDFSAERLWRDDHQYDAIVVLGYNDDPPVAGRGSAIFLHLVGDGATAGCVTIAPRVMRHLLPQLTAASVVDIHDGLHLEDFS